MLKLTPKERVLFVRRLTPVLLVLLGVFSLVTVNFIRTTGVAHAATANTVNFQARLQSAAGAIVPDGNYNVEFKLYSGASCTPSTGSGCTNVWTEDYLNSNGQGLKTINGYLSANLGSITAFSGINWDQKLWMSMNIGGTSTGTPSWDGAMKPYLSLTAVPYAFSAGQLNSTGAGGRSTLSVQGSDSGHGDQNFVIQDQGAAGTYNLLTQNSSTGITTLGAASSLTGKIAFENSGSANTVTLFSAAQTVGNATLTIPDMAGVDDTVCLQNKANCGSTISIGSLDSGTANANGASFSAGSLSLQSASSSFAGLVNTTTQTFAGDKTFTGDVAINPSSVSQTTFQVTNGSTAVLNVDTQNGRVTINDPTDPQYALDVNGDINSNTNVRVGGVAVCVQTGCTPSSGSGNYIQNSTSAQDNANINIRSASASAVTAMLQGANGQTADIMQVSSWNGTSTTKLMSVSSTGVLTVGNSSQFTVDGSGNFIAKGTGAVKDTSSTAFTIQDSSNATLLAADTQHMTLTLGTSGSGSVLVNNGATVNTTFALSNYTTGGSLGTAAATVDIYTSISVNQTTANQSLTVPTPTANTTYGRLVYISNVGTTSFSFTNTYLTAPLKPGATATLVWQNVNGTPSWTYAGSDGASILNQSSAAQTANFKIRSADQNTPTAIIQGATGQSASILQVQDDSGSTILDATTSGVNVHSLADSNQAFAVLSSSNSTVFNVATETGSVSIGTFVSSSTNVLTIQSDNWYHSNAVVITDATSGHTFFTVDNNGGILSKNLTNTGTAFQIQDSSGSAVLTADTTTDTVTIANLTSSNIFTNNGATVNKTLALSNFASGGSIGSAASTVDIYTSISVNQTTASQTLSVPSPTASTTYGRTLYISNVGTASFSFNTSNNPYLTAVLNPGATATLIWENVNGSANWTYAGSDGGSILNQNATTQSANFSINGTGQANTFQAATFSSASDLAITAGSSSTIKIGTGNSATISLGDTDNARSINIGNTAGTQAQTITIGNNSGTSSVTTIQGSNGIVMQTNGSSIGVTVKSTTNSTAAFRIQNSTSAALFNADTSTGTLTLGDSTSGNYITFTASGGLVASGTARHGKKISLTAEYAGAVADNSNDTGGANCSTNYNGTLTSGYSTGLTGFGNTTQNYYQWTSSQTSAQCYDVVVQIPIPADFSGWSSTTPLAINTYTSNTSNGTVAVQAIAGNGTTESSCNYVSATPGSTSTWTASGGSCTMAGSYNAGDTMTLRIRVTSSNSATVRLGNITLSYKSSF